MPALWRSGAVPPPPAGAVKHAIKRKSQHATAPVYPDNADAAAAVLSNINQPPQDTGRIAFGCLCRAAGVSLRWHAANLHAHGRHAQP